VDFYKRHYALLFAEAGLPDGIFAYDDLAFRNGPFFSPQVGRELLLPYLQEIVGFFHDYGLPVILHTCGDVRKLVPMILEAGFDCLQPMEAKAGCNVVEFAETYGSQIAYMGNIDVTVLNTNDRARVREEIVGKLEALKRLRVPYIFHSDHSIPPDIRMATYQYALELFREHGTY
jgi:uroporphyrinogen decarboxylase